MRPPQMASASHMLTWWHPQLHIIAQRIAEVASIHPMLWAVVGHHLCTTHSTAFNNCTQVTCSVYAIARFRACTNLPFTPHLAMSLRTMGKRLIRQETVTYM